MTYRHKLIDVALPLDAISTASDEETSVHVGKISNLHVWWSRKPLSVSRAIIFACLVDDPSEYMRDEQTANDERDRLFKILSDLVQWSNTNDEKTIAAARYEIARSVARSLEIEIPVGTAAIQQFLAKNLPPFLDPFAGGGSLPLEAQRLGLRTYASDLNPVAVLINKALIELPVKFIDAPFVHPISGSESARKLGSKQAELWDGEPKDLYGMVEDIGYYGTQLQQAVKRKIGNIYPKVRVNEKMLRQRPDIKKQGLKLDDELVLISWIWARTVECPNPVCKVFTPLVNKYWVSTHKGNEAWVNPIFQEQTRNFKFQIVVGSGKPSDGTVTRAGAKCQHCNTPITFDYIRREGRDGKIHFQLMCVVAEGIQRRIYLSPEPVDDDVLRSKVENNGFTLIDADLPDKALGFRVQKYGITNYRDFFTNRQSQILSTFCDELQEVYKSILTDSQGNEAYARAIITYLAFAINRLAQTNNTFVRWLVRKSGTSKGTPAFDRPIVSMVWEFSEGNVFANSVGSWDAALKNMLSFVSILPKRPLQGYAIQADAASEHVATKTLVSTDPPYFDNIGYGNLSDFFYLLLRKNLAALYPSILSTMLVPKRNEIVKEDGRASNDKKAKYQFMENLKNAFRLISQNSVTDYPATFYYAFRQTETSDDETDDTSDIGNTGGISSGWEAMLEALIQSGFIITGTWPIHTESTSRMRAISSNALASSIILVCRSRETNAPSSTRREFLTALNRELPLALRKLQYGSVAPVDFAQAAIGPGMATFSRYARILEADGSSMSIRSALSLINLALDKYLSEQEGEYESDTRWALAWFEQFGHNEAPFGVAETLSKAKNTSVNGLVEAGILEARSGKVRLLRRNELDTDWDPTKDKRLTSWEAVQHLIHILDTSGEQTAAELLARLGSVAETARDLAYRLYTVCERKGWAQDALGYNMLVVAWPRLKEQASRAVSQPELPL